MGVPAVLKGVPVLRLLVPFCLGIVFQHHAALPLSLTLTASILSFILAAGINLAGRKGGYAAGWLSGLTLAVFMFCFSVSLTGMKTLGEYSSHQSHAGGALLARVAGTPDERERNWRVVIEPIACISQGEIKRNKGKLLVWFEKDSLAGTLSSGDRVVLPNRVNAIRNYGNPFEFDYKAYMMHMGIGGEIWAPSGSWFVTSEGGGGGMRNYASRLRERLLGVMRDGGIKEKEYAVAGALILGYRGGLDRELRDAYAASGAMHILAVSGLHVGIIYMVVLWFLHIFRKNGYYRFIRPAVIVLVIWLYAFLTGLSPSVTRSATMFSFVAAGLSIGRPAAIFNTLASSALFQLLLNPSLLFLAGFQLSYAAVAGIVLYQPAIYSLARFRNIIAGRIWALTTVSIAAQLAIFPLIIYHFNNFPNLFLLTNLFAVPLAVIILYSGLAFIGFSFIPLMGSLFAEVLNTSIALLNYLTGTVGSLSFSQTDGIYVTLPGVLVIYGVLIMVTCFLFLRKPVFLFCAMILAGTGLLLRAEHSFRRSGQQVFIVYNDNRNSLYGFVSGRSKLLISGDNEQTGTSGVPRPAAAGIAGFGISGYSIISQEQFFLKPATEQNQLHGVKKSFVCFAGKKIFFALSNRVYVSCLTAPAEIDILVISSGFTGHLPDLLEGVKPSVVVFDSSNSYRRRQSFARQCLEMDLPFHDVSVSGAYTFNGGKKY